MKKFLYSIVLVLFAASIGYSQVTTLWEKSAATSSLTSWFSPSANTERGLAYGSVGGNDRVYIVSRNGGNFVYIYDAVTGDSVGTLRTDGISGGTFPVNDAEVSYKWCNFCL